MKKERVKTKNGTSRLWNVQYQVANVAANIIWAIPDMKNKDQIAPNILKTCSHLVKSRGLYRKN